MESWHYAVRAIGAALMERACLLIRGRGGAHKFGGVLDVNKEEGGNNIHAVTQG